MAKVNLKEKLLESKQVSSNIIVSSVLLDKLEVYGYVNSCRAKDMLSIPKNSYSTASLNGIVNKSPASEIVCSNFIYQVIAYYDGKQNTSMGLSSPIYKSLSINSEQMKYNLEDLYIPSLLSNTLYIKIKARIGTGVTVTDSIIKKNSFPENIIAEDSKAMFIAEEGAILLKNKDGEIRSIGEEVLVVCRYLHPESGIMCYTQFSLDELFVESEDDTI
jgi:hypothetical protein